MQESIQKLILSSKVAKEKMKTPKPSQRPGYGEMRDFLALLKLSSRFLLGELTNADSVRTISVVKICLCNILLAVI
jgi:hypothetical protein